jgi:two-component system OmpR family response regulator
MRNQVMEEEIFLLVDDDDELREELASYLLRYGVRVIEVASAEAARQALLNQTVSIVISDIVMPDETGLQLMRWIEEYSDVPVILLTALYDAADKVVGLEMGADDYMTKPFDQRELLARARAVLRRVDHNTDHQQADDRKKIQVDNNYYRLDMIHRTLYLPSGKEENLCSSASKLLEVLIQHQGDVVSRDVLYQEVFQRPWNPEDRGIDNLIVQLRKVLETELFSPTIIKTVRNQGYAILTEPFV